MSEHEHAHDHSQGGHDHSQAEHEHEDEKHAHASHDHGSGSHDHGQGGHDHGASGHDHGQSSHDHGDGDHSHQDEGILGKILHFFGLGHSHDYTTAARDTALSTSARGIRAVKISMAALLLTAFFQVAVVALTGSVALLADTVHNFSDALTALPLWLAFSLGRRAVNRRYTYGYKRFEDLAGALIVIMIAFTAFEVFRQAYLRIINPQPVQELGWLAAAAIIGFLGNELVALFRMRVGREIGSAALIADGLHARADGFTSLGVLVGAIGVWLGFPLADPIIAIIIGIAILGIVYSAARDIYWRMMDAVDPAIYDKAEKAVRNTPGVMEVQELRIRWLGHRLRSEVNVATTESASLVQAHAVAEAVRHALLHAIPELEDANVHVNPYGVEEDHHQTTAHHFGNGSSGEQKSASILDGPAGKEFATVLRPDRGIQIIDDITDQFGIDTLEGKIGPLMQGVGSQAHFIDLPAGLYTHPHPHPNESIIYTVRGRWVLTTMNGKRHLMQPGSLFWFGPDIGAGYEVPFDEPAFILIFKGQKLGTPEEFVEYLENTMGPSLEAAQASGKEVFKLSELPEDHPARVYAAGLKQTHS